MNSSMAPNPHTEKWANFGILCASISLVFMPGIFAVIGIISGALGMKQGASKKGRIAIFLSIIFGAIGMAINFVILTNQTNAQLILQITNGLYILIACQWVFWMAFTYRIAKQKHKEPTTAIILSILFGALATTYYIFVLPEKPTSKGKD